jgi:hypothetical protein
MEVMMAVAAQDDYAEHVNGYRAFVRGVQLIVAGLASLLLLLAYFLL